LEEIGWIVIGALLVVLVFIGSALRERRRILRQVVEEIETQGQPAGPLPGPYPNLAALLAFLCGAAGLFPVLGIPFGVATWPARKKLFSSRETP